VWSTCYVGQERWPRHGRLQHEMAVEATSVCLHGVSCSVLVRTMEMLRSEEW
jgi:hypothetical protein